MFIRRKNAIKNTRTDNIFDAIILIITTLVFIIVAYPLYFIIIASFSNPHQVIMGNVWLWPVEFTLEGYRRVFQYSHIWIGYRNTIFYTISGTLFTLFLVLPAAHALTKDYFPGKTLIIIIFMIPMFFGGGLIPFFLVVDGLGLTNTPFVLPLLGALSFMHIIIARTFMKTSIPGELHESAAIDGCSGFQIFFRIVLPLAKPIIAVIALFAAVTNWNAFFNALVFIHDRNLFPLQLVMRNILILESIDFGEAALTAEEVIGHMDRMRISLMLRYTLMILASLPIIMFYPFIQRYFVTGIMIGSVKG